MTLKQNKKRDGFLRSVLYFDFLYLSYFLRTYSAKKVEEKTSQKVPAPQVSEKKKKKQ